MLDGFAAAEAAVAPVMDMAAIAADPHVAATGMIAEIDGTPMQGLVARLAATPGRLRWAGKDIDADGADIRGRRLGVDAVQSVLATPMGQLTPVPPRPQYPPGFLARYCWWYGSA